jgi:glycosyltransferase involved in cell wall biosynthesis
MQTFKCIAITPYYKESRAVLERCIGSVKAQALSCEHLLVADGHPQDWVDAAGVRHLRLDRSHGDYGNTPRGVGAMMALAEEHDAIFFLDSDNWLEPNHIDECLAAARRAFTDPALCDYVISKRVFRRPDESILPIAEEPHHVDTNCFFFLRGSFHLLPLWITMPKAVAFAGDRVFLTLLNSVDLKGAATRFATVNYLCSWPMMYRNIGEPVPPELDPDKMLDLRPIITAMNALSPREQEIARRLLGGMKIKF